MKSETESMMITVMSEADILAQFFDGEDSVYMSTIIKELKTRHEQLILSLLKSFKNKKENIFYKKLDHLFALSQNLELLRSFFWLHAIYHNSDIQLNYSGVTTDNQEYINTRSESAYHFIFKGFIKQKGELKEQELQVVQSTIDEFVKPLFPRKYIPSSIENKIFDVSWRYLVNALPLCREPVDENSMLAHLVWAFSVNNDIKNKIDAALKDKNTASRFYMYVRAIEGVWQIALGYIKEGVAILNTVIQYIEQKKLNPSFIFNVLLIPFPFGNIIPIKKLLNSISYDREAKKLLKKIIYDKSEKLRDFFLSYDLNNPIGSNNTTLVFIFSLTGSGQLFLIKILKDSCSKQKINRDSLYSIYSGEESLLINTSPCYFFCAEAQLTPEIKIFVNELLSDPYLIDGMPKGFLGRIIKSRYGEKTSTFYYLCKNFVEILSDICEKKPELLLDIDVKILFQNVIENPPLASPACPLNFLCATESTQIVLMKIFKINKQLSENFSAEKLCEIIQIGEVKASRLFFLSLTAAGQNFVNMIFDASRKVLKDIQGAIIIQEVMDNGIKKSILSELRKTVPGNLLVGRLCKINVSVRNAVREHDNEIIRLEKERIRLLKKRKKEEDKVTPKFLFWSKKGTAARKKARSKTHNNSSKYMRSN